MPDWTKSMEQSYEYYTVDPTTLADIKRLDNVKKASFSRDSGSQTLGSATIDVTNSFGESYIRGYLKTVQNGVTEKFPLGTVLSQTPSSSFNGKVTDVSMDCYTPLIELKEKRPPLGYTVRKGTNIMQAAHDIVKANCRVPVGTATCDIVLQDNFTAGTNDTYLSFVIALIANANYELALDEMGGILFSPIQELDALQPVWTFNDDNSSILLPEITVNHDLYGIPNVVDVIYSYGHDCKRAVVRNDDPNSPTSTVSRGREIIFYDTDPSSRGYNSNSVHGYVTQEQLDAYAERILKQLSTLEYTVSFSHAYCPVRIGDCVRLNYAKAGITDIKAKIISQNIKAEPGCTVSAKAVFKSKLWR